MPCIDLTLCNNPNIISKHGIDISMFDNVTINIICASVDIRVPHPPSHTLKAWDYSRAKVTNIQQAIFALDWMKAFENLSASSKADVLNETLLNILRNYIPNKKIKFDLHG